MNTTNLTTFITVMQTGSISGAAEKLLLLSLPLVNGLRILKTNLRSPYSIHLVEVSSPLLPPMNYYRMPNVGLMTMIISK